LGLRASLGVEGIMGCCGGVGLGGEGAGLGGGGEGLGGGGGKGRGLGEVVCACETA
jgi:hypothetical protein